MKKLAFLLILFAFFSCKENNPEIAPPPPPSDRKVLVEEFTGVQCPGCPAGSAELENLLGIYGSNLVVISIHSGGLADPLPESTLNFVTKEGDDLTNYLGAPPFQPSAVINRRDFDGGNYRLQYGLAKWVGFIAQELEKDPKVSVNISKRFDPNTRELEVQVSGIALENITNELRLNIMISESNIINAQLDQNSPNPGGLVVDYVHKHAFRTTMTNFDGDGIADKLDEGENYDVTKTIVLPKNWKAANCEIIAFVTMIDEESKEVLQVESTHVED